MRTSCVQQTYNVYFHQMTNRRMALRKLCKTAYFTTLDITLVQFNCDCRNEYCKFYRRLVVTLLYGKCKGGFIKKYPFLK